MSNNLHFTALKEVQVIQVSIVVLHTSTAVMRTECGTVSNYVVREGFTD